MKLDKQKLLDIKKYFSSFSENIHIPETTTKEGI